MLRRGFSRRALLKFGASMAAALCLPPLLVPRITRAITAAPRVPLVWLRGQACGGDSEALLQPGSPSASELLIDTLAVNYHEGLMAAAGGTATQTLYDTLSRYHNGYIAVIEGAVPTGDNATYLTVGGRTFRETVAAVSEGAIGTIAVGSCAFDGGASAAAGGSTGAVGAGQVIKAPTLVNLPGCPVNPTNLAATVVHYLTYREFPPTDGLRRPLFAYGGLIHNQCERRAHFEFGEFVTEWGDEAAQKGWCLYKMGCKGPETFANCPTVKWADGASWSVLAGHGCIGCTMPAFWDSMGSAYSRLPSPVPFLPNVSADQIGIGLVGGVCGLAAVHGAGMLVRQKVGGRRPRPIATEPGGEVTEPAGEAAPAGEVAEVTVEAPTAEVPTAGAGLPEAATEAAPAPTGLEPAEALHVEIEAVAEVVLSEQGDEHQAAADEARSEEAAIEAVGAKEE